MTIDPRRVAARKAGRQYAHELRTLITDLPDGYGADYAESLCDELRRLLPQRQADVVPAEPVVPLARLGRTTLQFGQCSGQPLDDVPLALLGYYLKTAEENVKLFRAYLNHPDLRARRGAEMEDEG